MLRTMVYLNKNVDIKKFMNVTAFLKRKSSGYRPKKSRVFAREDITRFIKEADDKDYLLAKVILLVGIFGACRREEITHLLLRDIEDISTFIKITIPNTKTNVPRVFTISEGSITGVNFLEIFRKYAKLRPLHTDHQRFFLTYRQSKCCTLPVGVNTIGSMPKKIAEFLGLPFAKEYTGHCFRRCSATFLADSGADMTVLKRHGGWRSSSVAEGYVESSLQNKKDIAMRILGEKEARGPVKKMKTNGSPSTSKRSETDEIVSTFTCIQTDKETNVVISKEVPNMQFYYLSNCVFNFYNK